MARPVGKPAQYNIRRADNVNFNPVINNVVVNQLCSGKGIIIVCLVVAFLAVALHYVTRKDAAKVDTSGGSVPGRKAPDQFGPSDSARVSHLKPTKTQTSASISSFQLHAAIHSGDQDTVYDLIYNEAADINQKDHAGNTPLHIAARMGSQRLVNTLIKKGAKVNAGNELGRCPLHDACRSGHLEVVQILCEHGADVNVVDRHGASPLTEVMSQRFDVIFDYLLDHGANIDDVDANSLLKSGKLLRGASRSSAGERRTPLNTAAQLGNTYYVAKLLQLGAKPNVPDSMGWEPLHRSAFHGHADVVSQLLTSNASVDSLTKDIKATTALCLASQEGHLDVVGILLRHGAHVNHTQDDGASALFLAAQSGYANVVDTLLNHHARIKVTLKGEASTPLFMAVQEGHAQVVNKILDHDRMKRQSASSAMCLAAFSGLLSVVKALLDHGASVDAKNATANRTPLVYACQEGHLSVVRYLLDHGADINGKGGFRPLFVATYKNRSDIVRELSQRGVDVNVPLGSFSMLSVACVFGYAEVAAILIDHGAPLGLYTVNNTLYFKDDVTYLMVATRGNHAGVAKVLIDRGADINAQKLVTGETALLTAAINGSAEVAKVLLQHGARADIQSIYGTSPLNQASLYANHEVVKHLLSLGDILHSDLQQAFLYAINCNFPLSYILKHPTEYNFQTGHAYFTHEGLIRQEYKERRINIDSRLIYAYKAAFEEMVRLFLRHGIDVNMELSDMKSPNTYIALHVAVSGENLRIVQLLVEHGADLNARDAFGRTALDLAMEAGLKDIVDYLKRQGKQQKQKTQRPSNSP